MLELIEKGSPSGAHPTPLLFVHGGWHAAWCWEDHFLGFFADNGFRAVAVSLRGHGGSTRPKPLHFCSITDYVDDVAAAASILGTDPVVIGHSMGGFVVQKYLENHHAPAGVLMASMPSRAVHRAAVALRVMRRHPAATLRSWTVGTTADLVNTPRLTRDHFFSTHSPEHVVEACAERLQAESIRAPGWLVPSRPDRVTTPLLVLGREIDRTITNDAVHATADAYGTGAEFIPGMGHNMMLEPGWPNVAERIHSWLTDQGMYGRAPKIPGGPKGRGGP
jgi:pimeloyl-ACP methyl ester carboxylesterase